MLPDFANYSLTFVVAVFVITSAVILVVGVKLTNLADRFADQSGLGEAVTGVIFLGALTSLSGSVTSIVTAYQGHPDLSISNAFGGIAAQTVFLVVADFMYRRANLEHAAPSLPNIISATILIGLLSLVLCAAIMPPLDFFGIHPVSPVLFMVYAIGIAVSRSARNDPSWRPVSTEETVEDTPDEQEQGGSSLLRSLLALLVLGITIGICGALIAATGVTIAAKTGVREGLVGMLLTSIATSLPELVTTLVAVRRGALTLAFSGILGGNTFDVLFASMSDIAYRSGSIYHAISPEQTFLIVLSILMTSVTLLGMLLRQRSGPANVGYDSIALVSMYLVGIGIVSWVY